MTPAATLLRPTAGGAAPGRRRFPRRRIWGRWEEEEAPPAVPPFRAASGPPAQLAVIYGIASTYNGAGLTIAIVDAYNDPSIAKDLATFDSTYKLPAANLTVENQSGVTTASKPTAVEPELVAGNLDGRRDGPCHGPGRRSIILVEANSANTPDLMAAVSTASKQASVVSMSWGGSEFQGQQQYDSVFNKAGVTFISASGDDGGAAGAEWPSSSPYVVSVGGTTLNNHRRDRPGRRRDRVEPPLRFSGGGSAGGVSSIVRPSPHSSRPALGAAYRLGARPSPTSPPTPDSEEHRGLSVYDSATPARGANGWTQVGGTSAGSPVWAAVVAAADQARGGRPGSSGSLSSSQTLGPALRPVQTLGLLRLRLPRRHLRPRTTPARAGVGYDLVTGLGTPIATGIINIAVSYGVSPQAVARTATVVKTLFGSTTLTPRPGLHRHGRHPARHFNADPRPERPRGHRRVPRGPAPAGPDEPDRLDPVDRAPAPRAVGRGEHPELRAVGRGIFPLARPRPRAGAVPRPGRDALHRRPLARPGLVPASPHARHWDTILSGYGSDPASPPADLAPAPARRRPIPRPKKPRAASARPSPQAPRWRSGASGVPHLPDRPRPPPDLAPRASSRSIDRTDRPSMPL